jgi:CRP-like cAMP-binding protein
MIGASRETVTRLLSELRNKDIIQLKGSNLFIKDKTALEGVVNL